MGSLEHQEFWVLYLNNSNSVLYKLLVSKGGITATAVNVHLILKKAIELVEVAIILVHNHPSGNMRPSDTDRYLTQKLKKGASTLEIKVLDHLIVKEKTYFSFADENML